MPEVFISYAHADDQPFAEGAKGWVTALADRLQKALAMKPGGSQVKVWMDHRLEPQRVVDTALAERVARADCLVAVLSPRYLESTWCRDELDRFVTRTGTDSGRVFLVEFAPTERESWHAGVRNISPMQFWSQGFDDPAAIPLGWPAPDPAGDRPYWRALNELAHFMSGPLQAAGRAPGSAEPARQRVWLADPTDHVLDHWERLAAALRQLGCEVLPVSPGQYPVASEAQWRAALAADLRRADLLVQLLGPHAGRRPPWGAKPYTLLQADAVAAVLAQRSVPSLVWRAPEARLDMVTDTGRAALLLGASACGFEDFQQQVLALAASKALAPPGGAAQQPLAVVPATATANGDQAPLSICVNADAPDRTLGEQVRDMLYDLGVDANLAPVPAPDQSPAQWRQDYEAMLGESHGLVIVYGATPASWVQAQVQAARKLLARSRRGTWGALLDGPPGQQPDHGIRSHSLMLLDCRAGLAREPLSRFLIGLHTSGAAATAAASAGGANA